MTEDQEDRPSQRPTVVPSGGASSEGGGLPAEDSVIGGHRIVRLRGAGGQGVVYEARERGTDRLVALKTLLPGPTADDLRRFEREIEVLALLDHPSIPPLFDKGVHAGRPWFTMRLVDGPSLVAHVDEGGADAARAVRILLRVCDAVAHAHGRGVIHRDLKSDNIRVDQAGEPQVLDFGLAKWVAAPTITLASAPMGTLSHAAPEMLDGDIRKVDVRADVYSLGVILYRLIAGRLPLDLPENLVSAAERVRHQEPEPPSSARSGLDADLDAITLKCLAKSPGERYATVLDLARDLQAWMRHDPVEARGRAPGYRMRKALWRYRWPVAGAMAAVLVLASFVVVLAAQTRELRRERDRARVEENKARTMTAAFTEMIEDVDPERMQVVSPGEIPAVHQTAAALVDRVDRRARYAIDVEPRVRAAMFTAVGHAFMAIGIAPRAAPAYQTSSDILRELGDATADERALADLERAVADGWGAGQQQRAEEQMRTILADLRDRSDSPPALRARTLHELADLLRRRGRTHEALALAREALEIRRASRDNDGEAIKTMILEALLLIDHGEPDDALAVLDAADALAQPMLWVGHPSFARIAHARARALAALGRIDEAVRHAELAFTGLERSFGAAHPLVVAAASEGAAILSRAGRHAEAARRLRDVLSLQRIMLGTNDPSTRDTLVALATELDHLGKPDDAARLRGEAAIVSRRLDLALP